MIPLIMAAAGFLLADKTAKPTAPAAPSIYTSPPLDPVPQRAPADPTDFQTPDPVLSFDIQTSIYRDPPARQPIFATAPDPVTVPDPPPPPDPDPIAHTGTHLQGYDGDPVACNRYGGTYFPGDGQCWLMPQDDTDFCDGTINLGGSVHRVNCP